MKLLIAVLALITLVACDGIVPDIQNNALVQPTHEYEIDTWGSNSEIYEFTPQSAPGYTCIVFLTDGELRPAMQCIKGE